MKKENILELMEMRKRIKQMMYEHPTTKGNIESLETISNEMKKIINRDTVEMIKTINFNDINKSITIYNQTDDKLGIKADKSLDSIYIELSDSSSGTRNSFELNNTITNNSNTMLFLNTSYELTITNNFKELMVEYYNTNNEYVFLIKEKDCNDLVTTNPVYIKYKDNIKCNI